jgi:hypothetical protein
VLVMGGGAFCSAQNSGEECGGLSGLISGNYGDHVAKYNRVFGGMSEEAAEALGRHLERIANSRDGKGFKTNEEIEADQRQEENEQQKKQKKQKKQQKSRLQGPPPDVTTGDLKVDAVIIVALAAAAILIANKTEPGDKATVTTVKIKDEYVIVRGGATNDPPLNGVDFSGAFGVNIYDAGKGVPHNQLSHTTAGEIRKSGGTVVHKPEPAWLPNGPINIRHVNITLGRSNPFVGPIPNPAPRGERIPSKPKK